MDFGILQKGFQENTIDSVTQELVHDSHILKAICLWRLDYPLEAVKNLEQAKRFAKKTKKVREKVSLQYLEQKLLEL